MTGLRLGEISSRLQLLDQTCFCEKKRQSVAAGARLHAGRLIFISGSVSDVPQRYLEAGGWGPEAQGGLVWLLM